MLGIRSTIIKSFSHVCFVITGQLDLPEERMEAMVKAITLPEEFPDFESQLPDLKYSVFHPALRYLLSSVFIQCFAHYYKN